MRAGSQPLGNWPRFAVEGGRVRSDQKPLLPSAKAAVQSCILVQANVFLEKNLSMVKPMKLALANGVSASRDDSGQPGRSWWWRSGGPTQIPGDPAAGHAGSCLVQLHPLWEQPLAKGIVIHDPKICQFCIRIILS